MSNIEFQCNNCGQNLEIDEINASKTVQCPSCKSKVTAQFKQTSSEPIVVAEKRKGGQSIVQVGVPEDQDKKTNMLVRVKAGFGGLCAVSLTVFGLVYGLLLMLESKFGDSAVGFMIFCTSLAGLFAFLFFAYFAEKVVGKFKKN